jgi:hypothetical protein
MLPEMKFLIFYPYFAACLAFFRLLNFFPSLSPPDPNRIINCFYPRSLLRRRLQVDLMAYESLSKTAEADEKVKICILSVQHLVTPREV